MIDTASTRLLGTGTGTGHETGTGTVPTGSGSVSTPAELLPHGSAVTIDPWAREADGSTLMELELLGTITGSRNHPHSGMPIYRVSTPAGTDVEVDADRVHPAPVPADWALELETEDGWVPVPAGPGDHLSGETMIVPTLDTLHAFVLIAAGRARVPGSRVRASIAVANGLAAWHVELPLDVQVAYGAVIVLVSGRRLELSFGTLWARDAAVDVLVGLAQVVGVEPYGDCV